MMPRFDDRQLTLGELIDKLSELRGDRSVHFDFCGLAPAHLGSYRGFYDHLSLRWYAPTHRREAPTVASLLTILRAAVGATFEGYKGGDYRASLQTPLWVDEASAATSTALVGVQVCDHEIVLQTLHLDV